MADTDTDTDTVTVTDTGSGRKKATENLLPIRAGDLTLAYTAGDDLVSDARFETAPLLKDGIVNFVD
jgi:hypothetical protein